MNRPDQGVRLRCSGVGRDKDHDQSLIFYFNRQVSDDEMRALHDLLRDMLLERRVN